MLLAVLSEGPVHGYGAVERIRDRSGGVLDFPSGTVYPALKRLERRGLIEGKWVEKAGQRRRRYYRLTTEGRRVLAERRRSWRAFIKAVQQAAGLEYA